MWAKLVFMLMVVMTTQSSPISIDDEVSKADDESLADSVKKLDTAVKAMKKIMAALGRQTLLQQLFVEERIRSEGHSGVKQRRVTSTGSRNYHSPSHTGFSINSIHNHDNNIRTIGMGEVIAVLNGVEFRTRHNDFGLYMPSRDKKDMNARREIPFPGVPDAVLKKTTLEEQSAELREWFKAWKDQDTSVRDYRKYFKPVLCYMEAAWTKSTKDGAIKEPFESDRHFVDAKSWFDLQEKVRFTSYTGRKDRLENFSFLPTTIMNVSDDGYPEFAQWNYKIMCHPLKRDLPLNRLRVIEELGAQLLFKKDLNKHSSSRGARFRLNVIDSDKWREGRQGWTLLDELMAEIPGKDNYNANLTDDALGYTAYSRDPKKPDKELNAGYYHRTFKVRQTGASGLSARYRGYSDENLYMAMTTQPDIAGMAMKKCERKNKNKCTYAEQKWSYAIPLEIIYLTPLSAWNPYDIAYNGKYKFDKITQSDNRNGKDAKKAYKGTNSRLYYRTPASFFSGSGGEKDKADTTKGTVWVLDKKGKAHQCKSSGTRIKLPNIEGVGELRLRYPISPVHGEGSSVWKELEATKDVLLESKKYSYVFREPLAGGESIKPTDPKTTPTKNEGLKFLMESSNSTSVQQHTHTFSVTNRNQIKRLNKNKNKNKKAIRINIKQGKDIKHRINIIKLVNGDYKVIKCDGKKEKDGFVCKDQHPAILKKIN